MAQEMLKSAREAHAAEARGEAPLPGPRLSYRASTSLPPGPVAPARQALADCQWQLPDIRTLCGTFAHAGHASSHRGFS